MCIYVYIYIYMYILFHKRCVLHFVGGYPVCRHTMIKLWWWEYPGCEFDGFWNMERKYGLKRTNLQVFLHIFCQQMIWFWGPILNWKLELHPKTARIGPTQSPPGGWVGILRKTHLQVGTTVVSWEQSWSSGYGQHLRINDLVAGHGCWNNSVVGGGVCEVHPWIFSRLGSRIMEVDGRLCSFLNSKWGDL